MKRLILHIGMPKTGTTSIQEAFAQVASPEFRYAHLDFWENHSEALGTLFHDDPSLAMNHDLFKRTAGQISRRKRKFKVRFDRELARPETTVMMSGELVSRFSKSEAQALVDAIQASGRELFVVAYLRDPISYSSSFFQEVLKSYHTQRGRVTLVHYQAILRPWLKSVNRDHLIVQRFDPSTFVGGSATSDMAHVLGLPTPPQVQQKNSGLSDPVVRLLWMFSGLDVPQPHKWQDVIRRRLFIEILNDGIGGPKFIFPNSALRVSRKIEEQVIWLNKKFAIDFMPALDAVRGDAQSLPLTKALADISPQTMTALEDVLLKRGVTPVAGGGAEENLLKLYKSLSTTDVLRAAWAEVSNDGVARLRRSARERLRHPFD